MNNKQIVIPVNEESQALFAADANGNVNLYFGIEPTKEILKHGEMSIVSDVRAKTMAENAKVNIVLDRKTMVNLARSFLAAATKDEMINILLKSKNIGNENKKRQ